MNRIGSFIVAVVIGALSVGAPVWSAEPGPLTPAQRQLNLTSFDFVWTTIHDKHFDTTFGGLDWEAVKTELRPRMEKVGGVEEARDILYDMISRLGLSHFNIVPSDLYANIDDTSKPGDAGGITGIDARVIGGKALVIGVAGGTPAETAGVKPGWEIVKIDGDEIQPILQPLALKFAGHLGLEWYLAKAVTSRLRGVIGDSIAVVFRDGDGARVEKSLALIGNPGKKTVFGDLPPFYLSIKSDTLPGDVGYFAFSCFFDPVTLMTAFNSFMQASMNSRGVIIDVRGNPGGYGMIGMGMGGWLVAEKDLYLGTMSTRDTQLKMIINPRAQVYEGPVAVLVDGLSASSSEMFAGGLQDIGRARVFGSRTVGAALPSTIVKLPNGDGFQYVFANYVSRGGRQLEGRGVIPDEEVSMTREALLKGNDSVIDAALHWISEQNHGK